MQYSACFIKQAVKRLAVLPTIFLVSQHVFADADISVQPSGTAAQATANVDISVQVPEILIFGVGTVGTPIADVQWTLNNAVSAGIGDDQTYTGSLPSAFSGAEPYATTATAAILANGGTGSSVATNTANLPVFVFSNKGSDITIASTVGGGPTGAGAADVLDHQTLADTIAIAEFTSGQVGANITQPDFTAGGTNNAVITAGGGVVNTSDTWTYSYTPSSTPTAGIYEARITYVATQP